MRDIWKQINQAKVVIADLTFKNPNVFYELGLAHAIGKPVVLIAQTIDDIPFDLRSVRIVIYTDSPKGYDDLADQILRYLSDLGLV
jgi:nucleoside 2-deoxyribosyltransferase